MIFGNNRLYLTWFKSLTDFVSIYTISYSTRLITPTDYIVHDFRHKQTIFHMIDGTSTIIT